MGSTTRSGRSASMELCGGSSQRPLHQRRWAGSRGGRGAREAHARWATMDSSFVVGSHLEESAGHDPEGAVVYTHGLCPSYYPRAMKVILFGATGMVGQGVLRECLRAPDVERVLTVGRSGT